MKFNAFVASSLDDLKKHRDWVLAALHKVGFVVQLRERSGPSPSLPKRFYYRDRLEDCDLFILVVARRRGYIPPDDELSITQFEYQAAQDLGIDILIFMLDEKSPWPEEFDERDQDPEILRWREHLIKKHAVGFFANNPESIEIAPALARWRQERIEPDAPTQDEKPAKAPRLRGPKKPTVEKAPAETETSVVSFGHVEPVGDVLFTSTDARGTPGALNSLVLESQRYDLELPAAEALTQGYAHLFEPGKYPIILVVTVHPKLSTREALHRHLRKALKTYGPWLRDKTVWMPLMGTGTGSLKPRTSLEATLRAIEDARLLEENPPRHLILSSDAPRRLELANLAERHLGIRVSKPPKRYDFGPPPSSFADSPIEPAVAFSVPATSFSVPATVHIDPVELAFRLVLAHKADPDLLLRPDLEPLRQGLDQLRIDSSASSAFTAYQRLLDDSAWIEPNALWAAWLRQARAEELESIESELNAWAASDAVAS